MRTALMHAHTHTHAHYPHTHTHTHTPVYTHTCGSCFFSAMLFTSLHPPSLLNCGVSNSIISSIPNSSSTSVDIFRRSTGRKWLEKCSDHVNSVQCMGGGQQTLGNDHQNNKSLLKVRVHLVFPLLPLVYKTQQLC